MWHMLFWSAPHSASTFQTLTGLGVSLLVLGLSCLVAKKIAVALAPFAAVGRVALTMYAAQFVVIWALQLAGMDYKPARIPFGDLLVVIAALAAGWLIARLPNGPLEAPMRRFDRIFSPFRRGASEMRSGAPPPL
jgi:uncharacterized membrane protein YeiB